jgi:hypothetical protein
VSGATKSPVRAAVDAVNAQMEGMGPVTKRDRVKLYEAARAAMSSRRTSPVAAPSLDDHHRAHREHVGAAFGPALFPTREEQCPDCHDCGAVDVPWREAAELYLCEEHFAEWLAEHRCAVVSAGGVECAGVGYWRRAHASQLCDVHAHDQDCGARSIARRYAR